MKTSALFWLDHLAQMGTPELRRQLAAYHPALETIPERLTIFGAAAEGQRLAALCDSNGIAVSAIVDESPKQHGKVVAGRRVETAAKLDELDRDIPVIIASHRTLDAFRMLKAKGFRHVSPFAALQILHKGIVAPHMFHVGWFADLVEHRDRYADLAERLSDDESRKTLNSVLAYRQTLMPEMLADVTSAWSELYFPQGLFRFGRDETYVDAGTYDGDTIRLFMERTDGSFKKVVGFEPDPATFDRLATNFADDPRVVPVKAGLWSHSGTLRFKNDAGRASILESEGDVEVKVVALDEMLGGDDCSFIKMNIEGAEIEALKGARQTIRRFAPKLALSVYHRPSDLWNIPNLVDEIAPGYDLYLRQHCGGVVETVLYAVSRARVV